MERWINKIAKLCYELYKIDWERHISAERKADAWKDFYIEGYGYYDDFEDFLFGVGYSGEMYVSFYEFLDNEYLDEEYITRLLDNEDLIEEYKKDIR